MPVVPHITEVPTGNRPDALVDERLAPMEEPGRVAEAKGIVPISYGVSAAVAGVQSPDNSIPIETKLEQYGFAVDGIASELDPSFVAISDLPRDRSDQRTVIDIAAHAGFESSQLTPVVKVPAPAASRESIEESVDPYVMKRAGSLIINPVVRDILAIKGGERRNIDPTLAAIKLEAQRHLSGSKQVGLVIIPEAAEPSKSVEKDYDGIAQELSMVDFGITRFLLDAVPYARPSIAVFRGQHEVEKAAKDANVEVPDSLSSEQSDVAVSLGTELVKKYGAPGLHIITRNNPRLTSRIVSALRLALQN